MPPKPLWKRKSIDIPLVDTPMANRAPSSTSILLDTLSPIEPSSSSSSYHSSKGKLNTKILSLQFLFLVTGVISTLFAQWLYYVSKDSGNLQYKLLILLSYSFLIFLLFENYEWYTKQFIFTFLFPFLFLSFFLSFFFSFFLSFFFLSILN